MGADEAAGPNNLFDQQCALRGKLYLTLERERAMGCKLLLLKRGRLSKYFETQPT